MKRTITIPLAVTLGTFLAFVGTAAVAGRDASGTFTFNSVAGGYPFTTGNTISSSGVNANFAEVVTGLTASLDRNGTGPMLGALKLYEGGSVSTPELSWATDTNTGFYQISGGRVGLSLDGTLEADFSSTIGTTFTDPVIANSNLTVTGTATFNGATSGISASNITTGTLPLAQVDAAYVTTTVDLAQIDANTCTTLALAAPSAAVPGNCVFGASTVMETTIYGVDAWVSGAGTISIRMCASTNTNLPSRTYSALCFNAR